MIVVTTPMCRQIVEWAGLKDFKVNKHPDKEDGDFAILLSEVSDNTIRSGVSSSEVDVLKSYQKMKELGEYNETC